MHNAITPVEAPEAIPHRPEADTFDVRGALRRVLSAIFGHKLLILACCLFSLGLSVLYIKLFPPSYMASVMLTIEGERPSRDLYYLNWNLYRKGDTGAEVALMTASEPIGVVVDKLGLSYDDVYHAPLDHLSYLWQQSALGKLYRSLKNKLFPKPKSPFEPSPEVIARARAVSGFKDGTSLNWVAGTDAAYLVVTGPTPRVAEYANELIDAYLAQRRQAFVDEAEGSYQALIQAVDRARDERDRLIAQRKVFEEANGMALGFEKDRINLGMLSDLESKVHELEVLEHSNAAKVATLETLLAEEQPFVTKSRSLGRNSIREDLRRTLLELRTKLAEVRQRYRPGSPEVERIEKRIVELSGEVPDEPEMVESASTREINARYQALRDELNRATVALVSTGAELEAKRVIYEQLSQRQKAIPALEMKIDEFKQEMEFIEQRYGMLLEKLTTADMSRAAAASLPSTIRIVERANPPSTPVWPKTKLLIGVALVIGLIGGGALALFAEVLENRATADRLSLRNDLPVYATIELLGASASGGLQRLAVPGASGADRGLLADERRIHTRYLPAPSRTICIDLTTRDGRVLSGELQDLSLGGAAVRLASPVALTVDEVLDCTVHLPSGQTLRGGARVRRIIDEGAASGTLVAFHLPQLSRESHVGVQRLIADLRRDVHRADE